MDLNTLEIMKTEHKHLRLLHDNAPAHKACTVAEFLESEMVNTPQPPPPTLPRSCPCVYFLFHIWIEISFQKLRLICCLNYQYLNEYENASINGTAV